MTTQLTNRRAAPIDAVAAAIAAAKSDSAVDRFRSGQVPAITARQGSINLSR